MSFESPAKGFPWWRFVFFDSICVCGLVGHLHGSVSVPLFLVLSMKFCWSQNITHIFGFGLVTELFRQARGHPVERVAAHFPVLHHGRKHRGMEVIQTYAYFFI